MTFTAGASFRTSDSIANQRFYEAMARNAENLPRSIGEPDVIATGDTSTTDSSSVIANLSSLGFEFPADTIRLITMHAYIRGNTEHGVIHAQAAVLGGTNPVVSESNEIVTHSSGSTALDSAGIAVAINSTPTPDEVEVQITGLSGNPLQWVVHIFVGQAVAIPAAAS